MPIVGILAYGSLISDPGSELAPVIVSCVPIQTPFPVEFARSTGYRGGAPTLVPHPAGRPVNGVILVLDTSVTKADAENMLWRRETNDIGTGRPYPGKRKPGTNRLQLRYDLQLAGINVVISAAFPSNIEPLTAARLAELAVGSVRGEIAELRRDGISYLLAAKQAGVITPLSEAYEQAVLAASGAESLAEAREALLRAST